MKRQATTILNTLVERHTLTAEQAVAIEAQLADSKKTLEEVFLAEKIFSPAQYAAIKGELAGVPVIDLSAAVVPAAVLNLLTAKVAANYQMVVFERTDTHLKIGLVNPDDFEARKAADFLAQGQGLATEYYAITLADFRQVYKQYSGFKKEIGAAVEVAQQKFAQQEATIKLESESDDLETVVKTAPVAKIVSVIIKHAVDGGASDIHIEPGQNDSRVRYRIDGELHMSLSLPQYLHAAVISRIKVLANLKLDETRLPQDGRIRVRIDNQDVDLRISVLPMLSAEKIVMRVLDSSAGVPTLAELGYNPYHIEIIERNLRKPFGLFLLTGPTGSGKTTTLYSILNILNSDTANITTLEDPIEYYMTGVNQSQINPEIGFTFAHGLRAILRQDPNIIMVGEIRDNETVELVIHAGLTGHLVFSTLHTNDAWGAIPRLVDMKAEPFLLSSTLNIVMAQRLARKLCPDCKKPQALPPALATRIMAEVQKISKELLPKGTPTFYHGAGCTSCAQSGYTGRTVIGEILEVTTELKDLIASGVTGEQIRAALEKQHPVTMFQDGLIKALNGVTTLEEVLRVADSGELS